MARMANAIIGKLYSNTPVGSTGVTEFYPVTSTKAVFLDRAETDSKNTSLNTYLGTIVGRVAVNENNISTLKQRVDELASSSGSGLSGSIAFESTEKYLLGDLTQLSIINDWSKGLEYFPTGKLFIWTGATGSVPVSEPAGSSTYNLESNTLYKISSRVENIPSTGISWSINKTNGTEVMKSPEDWVATTGLREKVIERTLNGQVPIIATLKYQNVFNSSGDKVARWCLVLESYATDTKLYSPTSISTAEVALSDSELIEMLGITGSEYSGTIGDTITITTEIDSVTLTILKSDLTLTFT